ncbi:glycosyltransferase family 4 protein, partial [Vibrio vulnificus]|nr:glycosyltransferase family 4 protein [Vibrio vulnificus]
GGPTYGINKIIAFRDADIFILPSYNEGQPISILEAYISSCYVVTTDVGGIKDIFQDQLNGKFIEVGNELSIYDVLIDLDSDEVKRVSSLNRAMALNKYTYSAYFDRIISIMMG